ncbi:MAG: kinase/pyrophosphorylase [Bacteroidales bacterium]|nr:kinase/pyrophosphorylase [Bacteroidales bacterium]
MNNSKKPTNKSTPTIYLISGASGASGRLLLETILAQFPNHRANLIIKRNIRSEKQLIRIVEQAQNSTGFIVHTLVDPQMRQLIISLSTERGILNMDLMGDISTHLTNIFGEKPVGKPGLYQSLHQDYFQRISAIEYTVLHDDGRNPQGIKDADIILTGVSRSGKTPLSMYLAVLGYKVANIPFVNENLIPEELKQADHLRVFGLTINSERLIKHRVKREQNMGIFHNSSYTNFELAHAEVESALKLCKKYRWKIINVSNQAIESSADQIIEIYNHRFESKQL